MRQSGWLIPGRACRLVGQNRMVGRGRQTEEADACRAASAWVYRLLYFEPHRDRRSVKLCFIEIFEHHFPEVDSVELTFT